MEREFATESSSRNKVIEMSPPQISKVNMLGLGNEVSNEMSSEGMA